MDHGRREPVILRPGQGRSYDCGSMRAVFKADGIETASRYSVSEWWLEQNSRGPGAHSHEDNDELFLVLEGEPSILVAETWHQFSPGSFLMIPARTVHDFENRTYDARRALQRLHPRRLRREHDGHSRVVSAKLACPLACGLCDASAFSPKRRPPVRRGNRRPPTL